MPSTSEDFGLLSLSPRAGTTHLHAPNSGQWPTQGKGFPSPRLILHRRRPFRIRVGTGIPAHQLGSRSCTYIPAPPQGKKQQHSPSLLLSSLTNVSPACPSAPALLHDTRCSPASPPSPPLRSPPLPSALRCSPSSTSPCRMSQGSSGSGARPSPPSAWAAEARALRRRCAARTTTSSVSLSRVSRERSVYFDLVQGGAVSMGCLPVTL